MNDCFWRCLWQDIPEANPAVSSFIEVGCHLRAMATSALAEEEVRAELARAKLEQVRARRALILAESDLFRARDEAQRALDLAAAVLEGDQELRELALPGR